MLDVQTTEPTAAEMDAAAALDAYGYSAADGVDHATVAAKAIAAAEALDESWEAVSTVYAQALAASDHATTLEMTAATDDLVIAHAPIHNAMLAARSRLMTTAAPHWAGLAIKADAFLRMWGDDETSRYALAAKRLAIAAAQIGEVLPSEANVVEVMEARGHAERLCYYLAHDDDGYRNWACSVGGVGRIASEAERIASESRDLASATPVHQGMSGEIISAVWFGHSAVLDAHEPTPPSWDAQIRVLEAARAEAQARGVEVDAVFDDEASGEHARAVAEKRYQTAQSLADTALDAIIDRPVATVGELLQKHQLAADRWIFGNEGETLADPAFVARIISDQDAVPSLVGRIHQDLQRLAGVEGDCFVGQQATRFADAVVRHSELDGERGEAVEAECDAQWHAMMASETTAQAGVPTSRSGVAFQLLCAVGEIEVVENGRDDEAKREAGEKIRLAVVNAIAALGLPADARTAEFFLGDRLARRLAQ